MYPNTFSRHTHPLITAAIVSLCCFLFVLNEAQAQLPGNIHLNIGGRGVNFSGNVPADKAAELFKSGKLRFQEGVLKGDVERVKRWVKPEFVNDPIQGNAPVCYAAAQGNGAMIRLLASNGASMRVRFRGRSLAYVAASYGHSDTAKLCASLGGGRDEDVSSGRTLYAANSVQQHKDDRRIRAESSKLANQMLDSFFQPNPPTSYRSGETPMMHAQREVDDSMDNDLKSLAQPFVRQFMSENQ